MCLSQCCSAPPPRHFFFTHHFENIVPQRHGGIVLNLHRNYKTSAVGVRTLFVRRPRGGLFRSEVPSVVSDGIISSIVSTHLRGVSSPYNRCRKFHSTFQCIAVLVVSTRTAFDNRSDQPRFFSKVIWSTAPCRNSRYGSPVLSCWCRERRGLFFLWPSAFLFCCFVVPPAEKVIGYVASGYGRRSESQVKGDIDRYKARDRRPGGE